MKKKIPEFQNKEEEFDFWPKVDTTEYVDWSKAKRAKLPSLKPTLRTISVRLPVAMVENTGEPEGCAISIADEGVSGRARRARAETGAQAGVGLEAKANYSRTPKFFHSNIQ